MCREKSSFSKVCVRLVVLEQKVEMILRHQIIFDHYEPWSDYSDVFHCRLSLPSNLPPLQSSGQCMHHVF
jgi:hypothetical protein